MIRSLPPAAAAIAALALAGCVSLFPKAEPSQMYRLGAAIPAASEASAAKSFQVLRGRIGFAQAAASDRILTVNGAEAAYIAGARWVAPAPVLFEEALSRVFANTAGAPRLLEAGRSRASAVLRLEVEDFQAVYDNGMDAPPEVVVRIRASLVRSRDSAVLGERVFETRRRASDNRVSAIVPAFDAAMTASLTELAGWTGGFAGEAGA